MVFLWLVSTGAASAGAYIGANAPLWIAGFAQALKALFDYDWGLGAAVVGALCFVVAELWVRLSRGFALLFSVLKIFLGIFSGVDGFRAPQDPYAAFFVLVGAGFTIIDGRQRLKDALEAAKRRERGEAHAATVAPPA